MRPETTEAGAGAKAALIAGPRRRHAQQAAYRLGIWLNLVLASAAGYQVIADGANHRHVWLLAALGCGVCSMTVEVSRRAATAAAPS